MGFWDFLNPFTEFLDSILKPYGLTEPPLATITLMLVSVAVTLLSVGVTVLVVDMDKLQQRMKEIQDWNMKRKKAQDTADKKLWIEVQRKQQDIQKLQMSMMTERMIPSFILFLPFIIMFRVLRSILGTPSDYGKVLAVWPFHVPDWLWPLGGWFHPYQALPGKDAIFFGFWYFMTAVTTGIILQRIIGVPLPGVSVQQNTN